MSFFTSHGKTKFNDSWKVGGKVYPLAAVKYALEAAFPRKIQFICPHHTATQLYPSVDIALYPDFREYWGLDVLHDETTWLKLYNRSGHNDSDTWTDFPSTGIPPAFQGCEVCADISDILDDIIAAGNPPWHIRIRWSDGTTTTDGLETSMVDIPALETVRTWPSTEVGQQVNKDTVWPLVASCVRPGYGISATSSGLEVARVANGGIALSYGGVAVDSTVARIGCMQLTVPEDISGEWFLHVDIADNIDFEHDPSGMNRHAASYDYRTASAQGLYVYDGEIWTTGERSVQQWNAGMSVVVDLRTLFGDLSIYMNDADGNGARGLVRYYWTDDTGEQMTDSQSVFLGTQPGNANPVGMAAGAIRNIVEQMNVTSGAIMEGEPFSTTIPVNSNDSYTILYDSQGLRINYYSEDPDFGSPWITWGALLTSGGMQFNASHEIDGYETHVAVAPTSVGVVMSGVNDNTQNIQINTDEGISIYQEYEIGQFRNSFSLNSNGITANGSAITQNHSVFTGSVLNIGTLSGGKLYSCTTPLSTISVGSIADGCNTTILFTAASAGTIINIPSGIPFFGEDSATSGTKYVLAIDHNMAVCASAAIQE